LIKPILKQTQSTCRTPKTDLTSKHVDTATPRRSALSQRTALPFADDTDITTTDRQLTAAAWDKPRSYADSLDKISQ